MKTTSVPFGPRTSSRVQTLPSTPLSSKSRAFQPKLQMLVAVSAIAASPLVTGLRQPLDDPHIPIGGLAEHLQRGLIALAVVGGHGLFHAVELDHDHALGDPRLVRFRGVAAREKAPAGGGNGGTRELRVSRQCVRIRNRTI